MPGIKISQLLPFGIQLQVPTSGPESIPPPSLLLDLLGVHKLVLVRGLAPLSPESLLSYWKDQDQKNDPFLHWDFGPVMEMKENPESQNYLFSREAVPLHWDGAFHKMPSVLVFNCVESPVPGSGGETFFSDGEKILATASAELQAQWKKIHITYETQRLAHYGGTISVPLVGTHPKKNIPVLRFAEKVETTLNPVTVTVSGAASDVGESVVGYLSRRLYEPDLCYVHKWQMGDLLLVDNHSLLHGRRAFLKDCPRHLRRVQLM
jgi:alpha-ketoglutarate-dependent taurine dioxygenase